VNRAVPRSITRWPRHGQSPGQRSGWVSGTHRVCPGFVDTEMGQVIPDANRSAYLAVDDIVEVVRMLLTLGENVKVGPEILVRTMRNPMTP
jgi:hypothetical protein